MHPAGTAYVDPGGVVHIARNEGTADLVVLVTRIIPGAPLRGSTSPTRGNCDFDDAGEKGGNAVRPFV